MSDVKSLWSSNPRWPGLPKLIDCEEDRVLRAVPVGMLREAGRWAGCRSSAKKGHALRARCAARLWCSDRQQPSAR